MGTFNFTDKALLLNGIVKGQQIADKIKGLEKINPEYQVSVRTIDDSEHGTFVHSVIEISDMEVSLQALSGRKSHWINAENEYRLFSLTPFSMNEEDINKDQLEVLARDIQTLFQDETYLRDNPFLDYKKLPYATDLEIMLQAGLRTFGELEKLRGTGRYMAHLVQAKLGLSIVNGRSDLMHLGGTNLSHSANFDEKSEVYVDLTLQQFDPELPSDLSPGRKYWEISGSGFPNDLWRPHLENIPKIAVYKQDPGLMTDTDFPFTESRLVKDFMEKLFQNYENLKEGQ